MEVLVHKKVCRLQISVDNSLFMEIFDDLDHLCDVKCLHIEINQLLLSKESAEIPIQGIVKDKVEFLLLSEGAVKPDYAWMVEFTENGRFVPYLINLPTRLANEKDD